MGARGWTGRTSKVDVVVVVVAWVIASSACWGGAADSATKPERAALNEKVLTLAISVNMEASQKISVAVVEAPRPQSVGGLRDTNPRYVRVPVRNNGQLYGVVEAENPFLPIVDMALLPKPTTREVARARDAILGADRDPRVLVQKLKLVMRLSLEGHEGLIAQIRTQGPQSPAVEELYSQLVQPAAQQVIDSFEIAKWEHSGEVQRDSLRMAKRTFLEALRLMVLEDSARMQLLKSAHGIGLEGADPWGGLPKGSEVRVLPLEEARTVDLVTKANRLKLIFIGDGFKEAEKEKFFEAANRMYKYLFSLPGDANQRFSKGTVPFNSYDAFFVVAAVFVPSKDSGSCIKGKDRVCPKNTAFRSYFNCQGIERLTCLDPRGDLAARTSLAKVVPDWHIANVIINDTRYGGSGGNPSTTTLDSNAHELVAHELIGHNLARLGDEYEEPPYPGYPDGEESNTTKESNPLKVKWADLVGDASGVGLFLGARYDKYRFYRPAKTCKMRTLGRPFCSVCVRGIIHAIHERVRLIETFEPIGSSVKKAIIPGEKFRVGLIDPDSLFFRIRWSIVRKDGAETVLSDEGFDFKSRRYINLQVSWKELEAKGMSQASKLRVTVSDLNPLATVPGTEVHESLQDSQEWSIVP